MPKRVDSSTAEWLVSIIKNGREAFEDIGEERPLKMMDALCERSVMDRVAKALFEQRMTVVEQGDGLAILHVSNEFGSLSLYGALRWGGLHGFEACSDHEMQAFLSTLSRSAIGKRYFSSCHELVALAKWDGYSKYTIRGGPQMMASRHWVGDNETLFPGDKLLMRQQPLQLLEGQPTEDGVYCLSIERPITQEELDRYLWLYELELDCVTNIDPQTSDVLSAPGSLVNAHRSNLTHCRACFGRGDFLPVSPGPAPRQTCEVCKGTGRIPRKGK